MEIDTVRRIASRMLCMDLASVYMVKMVNAALYKLEEEGLIHITGNNIGLSNITVNNILSYMKDRILGSGKKYEINSDLVDEPVKLVGEYIKNMHGHIVDAVLDEIIGSVEETDKEAGGFLFENKDLVYDTIAFAVVDHLQGMAWPLITIYRMLFRKACADEKCIYSSMLEYIDRNLCMHERAEEEPEIKIKCRTAGGKNVCCIDIYTYKPVLVTGGRKYRPDYIHSCFIADELTYMKQYLDLSPTILLVARGETYTTVVGQRE